MMNKAFLLVAVLSFLTACKVEQQQQSAVVTGDSDVQIIQATQPFTETHELEGRIIAAQYALCENLDVRIKTSSGAIVALTLEGDGPQKSLIHEAAKQGWRLKIVIANLGKSGGSCGTGGFRYMITKVAAYEE